MEDTLRIFYAYYVSENDDLTYLEKLDMLDLLEDDTEAFLNANPALIEFVLHEAPKDEGGVVDRFVKDKLNKALAKLKGQLNDATDAKKAELNTKIAAIEKKLRGAPPSPKGDISPIQDFPTKLVPAHQVRDVAPPPAEPGKLAKAAQGAVDIARGAVDYASQHPGKSAAIAATAAAVITGGVVAYRRFLSKAARECKGAANKSKCMQSARQKALKAKIQAMQAGKAKCSNTNKPYTCRHKIDTKIQKLQAKVTD